MRLFFVCYGKRLFEQCEWLVLSPFQSSADRVMLLFHIGRTYLYEIEWIHFKFSFFEIVRLDLNS